MPDSKGVRLRDIDYTIEENTNNRNNLLIIGPSPKIGLTTTYNRLNDHFFNYDIIDVQADQNPDDSSIFLQCLDNTPSESDTKVWRAWNLVDHLIEKQIVTTDEVKNVKSRFIDLLTKFDSRYNYSFTLEEIYGPFSYIPDEIYGPFSYIPSGDFERVQIFPLKAWDTLPRLISRGVITLEELKELKQYFSLQVISYTMHFMKI